MMYFTSNCPIITPKMQANATVSTYAFFLCLKRPAKKSAVPTITPTAVVKQARATKTLKSKKIQVPISVTQATLKKLKKYKKFKTHASISAAIEELLDFSLFVYEHNNYKKEKNEKRNTNRLL